MNAYATEAFISQVKEARRTIASAIRAITPLREPDKLSADAVAAYTDVVRQGDAIYRQEQNDIQDRRAIRTFDATAEKDVRPSSLATGLPPPLPA